MLKVVGLTIGNIEDISIRALKELFSAETVIAEDTRNYIKIRNILAERFAEIIVGLNLDPIHKPKLISYREQNHAIASREILMLLKNGENAILISDAGMPAISDPGQRLIEYLIENKEEVEVIPGPVALETALVASGFNTLNFIFLGFLPKEKGKIIKLLEKYNGTTIIVYESPFRVTKLLEIIEIYDSSLKVACCNDLTKKFQKVYRGLVGDVLVQLKKTKILGEWCLVIAKH